MTNKEMTREEALNRIEFRVRRSCPDANGDNIGECDGCCIYPCNEMKAVIFLAQERPHGEWVWKEWVTPMSKISYCKCSVCGIGMGSTEYDFCPNCGADMRKEGEGND